MTYNTNEGLIPYSFNASVEDLDTMGEDYAKALTDSVQAFLNRHQNIDPLARCDFLLRMNAHIIASVLTWHLIDDQLAKAKSEASHLFDYYIDYYAKATIAERGDARALHAKTGLAPTLKN